jgi:hypothetical protein
VFVVAEAVPKKILDLMNDETLTVKIVKVC